MYNEEKEGAGMTAVGGKKGLALCILEVLRRHSSQERPMTIKQIEDRLRGEFGMEAGRNGMTSARGRAARARIWSRCFPTGSCACSSTACC